MVQSLVFTAEELFLYQCISSLYAVSNTASQPRTPQLEYEKFVLLISHSTESKKKGWSVFAMSYLIT